MKGLHLLAEQLCHLIFQIAIAAKGFARKSRWLR